MGRLACTRCRVAGEQMMVVLADRVGELTAHALELYVAGRRIWLPYYCTEPLGPDPQGQPQYVVPAGVARLKKIPAERLRAATAAEDQAAVSQDTIDEIVRAQLEGR